MIDIITVVFGEELPILSCQAQSIDLYCQDLGIEQIFVMVNESNLADEIDLSWYGSLADKVRIVPRETFQVTWPDNGWLNQQLLKILGGSMSRNTWSMVLDAKTVLTRSFTKDQLLTDQGQAKFGWIPIKEVFHPARDIANKLFDSDNGKILSPSGVPFFFHNESIRSMIDYVESKTQEDFKSWFLDRGMLTEFVLYSAWIALDPARRNLYTGTDEGTLRICHVCHVFADQFDQIVNAHDDLSHTLSVHRRTWAGLSDDQKQLFRQKLLQKGISRASILT